MYLQDYGYMNKPSGKSASLISRKSVSMAIKDFQRFTGLAQTGKLDRSTLNMMNMPRCGVPDKGGSARRKRYALQGSKWDKTYLTYRISKYPRILKDRQKVDKVIAKAFKLWSDVTNLRFVVSEKGSVDIDVRFEKGEHGDGKPFDGSAGPKVAHAFYPEVGDAHFDDEEEWTINQNSGIDLFEIAAHEFGHSLGLSHSDVLTSAMTPLFREYNPYFKLHEDDIRGIQALYGRPPDLCQDASFQAATTTADGKTYVFKGDYYWVMTQSGIPDGGPRKISDDWGGLPGNLDAALSWSDGRTFFFKKDQYWRFRNKKMDSGYPKAISAGFEGIPNNIDAAFDWSGNEKTYFFKGSKYWKYDTSSEPYVSSEYPKPISNWEGLPDNIDAAFQWTNKVTYFFKGKSYYRFNDDTFSVDEGNPAYPRSTAIYWFECKASLNGNDRAPIYIGNQTTSTAPTNSTSTYNKGRIPTPPGRKPARRMRRVPRF